jgi:putative nucleotidyltransferase with HDIG domain
LAPTLLTDDRWPMIKKIAIKDLVVGMYVERFDLSWFQYPFLSSKRKTIKSFKEIQQLKALGVCEVYINTEKGLDVYEGEKGKPVSKVVDTPPKESSLGTVRVPSPKPSEGKVPLEKEIENASKLYSNTIQFVKNFIKDARMGKVVHYKKAVPLVNTIIESVMRNPNALTTLTNLKSYDAYTYTHCVNVAVLSVVFGKFLGFSLDRLSLIGIGGLFHDIGKCRLPEEILNKPGGLTKQEFEIMKKHPREGYESMQRQEDIPSEILAIILEHHEKYNGRGYPQGLSEEEITRLANIVSVVDVYDALTTDRVYRKAVHPYKAMKILFMGREQDFYPGLAEMFVKCLGIYPVGSLVKIDTGEYGIVVEIDNAVSLYPKVKILWDRKMRPCEPKTVDLAGPDGNIGKSSHKIVECIDSEAFNIEAGKLLVPHIPVKFGGDLETRP